MEPCLFARNFWGEKNTGFDVLYQNLKLSYRSTSEFAEFVRDSSSIEDAYYKSLLKLAKQTGSYSNNSVSSFKPCWSILRQLVEQLGQLHLVFAQSRQSLSKDVQKYLEEQQKRHKSIRDAEASTQEVVHAFQVTAVQLHRAKEVYHSRYAEYERTMRSESSSTREQEKMEAKLKKAQDEYKYSVEKYNNLRNQFVSKMAASCAQFQEVEVAHLEQMREFMQRYSSVWSAARDTMDKLCAQFNQDLTQMTTARLLDMFVAERGTGTTEPRIVPFEDAEVAAVFSANADNAPVAVRAVDMFNNEQRASSALAGKYPSTYVPYQSTAVGSASKENGNASQNSLTDLSADAVSVASGSLATVPASTSAGGPTTTTTAATATTTTKRREGFFRRRRNSLTQEPGLSTSDSTTVAESMRMGALHPIGGSLSAFNVVAKRGIRRLGTPLSNGKEKLTNKQDSKSVVYAFRSAANSVIFEIQFLYQWLTKETAQGHERCPSARLFWPTYLAASQFDIYNLIGVPMSYVLSRKKIPPCH
ncbi:unnamed protein product [Echinostoma caproni]|uniref:F-BAR domain-containing protein n=1 Tax=Echinostoma caproni TaxID=27848 RepID=A0A183AXU1_9TREM|nr:unnamed protein product [Echinostoma caproni]